MVDWIDLKNMVNAADRGDHESFAAAVDRLMPAFDVRAWDMFLQCVSLLSEDDLQVCRRHADLFRKAKADGVFSRVSFGSSVRAEIIVDRF